MSSTSKAAHAPAASTRPTKLVLDADKRSRRVHFVGLVLLVFAGGMLWLAADAAQSYGLSPADGGVRKPEGTRYSVAALIAVLGLLPLYGIWAYARCYVTRLVLEPVNKKGAPSGGGAFVVHTLAAKNTEQRFDLDQLASIEEMSGRGGSARAPWVALRVRGRRLPFILDEQADTFDRSALLTLMSQVRDEREHEDDDRDSDA